MPLNFTRPGNKNPRIERQFRNPGLLFQSISAKLEEVSLSKRRHSQEGIPRALGCRKELRDRERTEVVGCIKSSSSSPFPSLLKTRHRPTETQDDRRLVSQLALP